MRRFPVVCCDLLVLEWHALIWKVICFTAILWSQKRLLTRHQPQKAATGLASRRGNPSALQNSCYLGLPGVTFRYDGQLLLVGWPSLPLHTQFLVHDLPQMIEEVSANCG